MNSYRPRTIGPVRYFVPIIGNYYHFITESALGLYRVLADNDLLTSKDCKLWYQGQYRTIVQMFSKCLLTQIPISKPYLKNGTHIGTDIETLKHIRVFQHPNGRRDLVRMRDFLASQIPCSPERKGILVIKRQIKRSYREHDECISQLGKYGLPVRVAQLETLSFADQVNLLRNTRILIAPHGAGTLNMIFMDPGAKIVELFPRGIENWHATEIARIFGHQLAEIESQSEGPFHREPPGGVRQWIETNGWPSRRYGQQWRQGNLDLYRAVRDVAHFSIPVAEVIQALDSMNVR